MTEGLGGPGGGPDWQPIDQVGLNTAITSRGAGAFPVANRKEDPPKPAKTATVGYEDQRFNRKPMRKKMRPR